MNPLNLNILVLDFIPLGFEEGPRMVAGGTLNGDEEGPRMAAQLFLVAPPFEVPPATIRGPSSKPMGKKSKTKIFKFRGFIDPSY